MVPRGVFLHELHDDAQEFESTAHVGKRVEAWDARRDGP
jgi:hypothetical protein